MASVENKDVVQAELQGEEGLKAVKDDWEVLLRVTEDKSKTSLPERRRAVSEGCAVLGK